MLPLESLISTLADGEFHSGVELGLQLKVSRTAVWKTLRKLNDIGIEVEKVKGKGYRIAGGIDLLRKERLLERLDPKLASSLGDLVVLMVTESTNAWMLQHFREGGGERCSVCMAEYQLAGRGRRGRSWVSTFGQNICLSLGYSFKDGFSILEGLSLAVGVMVADALHGYQLEGLGLKWPNDIWMKGKKIGGVLIEVSGEQGGPCQVVVGIGLNVLMNKSDLSDQIDQDWTALRSETALPIERNELAAELIGSLVCGLQRFEASGFSAFKESWEALDVLRGSPVQVLSAQPREGVSRGIGRFGHLLLETSAGVEEIAAGEVSLRRL